MADFKKFAVLIDQNFDAMSTGELYTVDIAGDELYETYLDSFPEGMNEIYRTRRKYDCSADKNFIRNLGNVVTIVDGQIVTVFHPYNAAEYPFNVVAEKLDTIIKDRAITSVFRTKESGYGAEIARELTEDGTIRNWYNLHASIAKRHKTANPEKDRGELNTKASVFKRGLEELSSGALEDVSNLIQDDLIYRGTEHKKKVTDFVALHRAYQKLNSDQARNIFIWDNINSYIVGFKNEVIGSLVEDISKGVDLEQAVKKFESKVAPQNYKRSKSLITPSMIKDAVKVIDELGLETALERRMARFSDVNVNDVLFVDNSVKPLMKGGVADLLMTAAVTKSPDLSKAQEISIEKFMTDVVPVSKSIEVMVKNSHATNFVTLTAPVHDNVERLFKWDNNFGWSYDGNVTDSGIKEKVALAGGNVTNAALRISLAWSNHDDLDLHVVQPDKVEVYFGNKLGKLDVDMNAGGRMSREPVENVSYTKANLRDGVYKVYVNQFSQREYIDVGYGVEVECNGVIYNFGHDKVAQGKKLVVDIKISNGMIESIKPATGITGQSVVREKWGIKTETLVPVDTIVLSPNYWLGDGVGNKHYFFILKDCKNPEKVRGIYNEFLRGDLDKHRKVFEILGDKTKCDPVEDQLSGIGFSSTIRNDLTAVVKNATGKSSVYKINF